MSIGVEKNIITASDLPICGKAESLLDGDHSIIILSNKSEDGSFKYVREELESLFRELDKVGWHWCGGESLIEFNYSKNLSYVAMNDDCIRYSPGKVDGDTRKRFYFTTDSKSDNIGDNCPSCGTTGEWIGLAMKCPKCWKTW